MLYVKEAPTGVDIPIQRLQQRLYGSLCKAWGIEAIDYNCFGRVYRNQTKTGYIPEAYIGGGEYRDTFFDDRVSATSFFAVGNTSVNTGNMKSVVSLIFCVNLDRLRPKTKHRADEEVHLDVVGLCDMFGFSVDSIVSGMDNVFREYSSTSIKFSDMHPFHCFRVNLSVSYKKC